MRSWGFKSPLAHSMVYPPPVRRRRRRRLLLLLATVGIAALIVVLVVQLRTERRNVGEYLEVAFTAAQSYRDVAADIDMIVTDLAGRERPTVLAALDEAVATAEAADTALLEAVAPVSVGPASGFIAAASASWRSALTLLEDTMLTMLDDPGDIGGITRLDAVFLDFRVGDRAYSRFLDAVTELDPELVAFTFPEVRFIAGGKELAYDGEILAERIQALARLSAVHDLAIADVAFVPAPVGDQEGVPVVPFAETFEVQVTLANRGNEPESGLAVEVTLFRQDGSQDPASEQRTVETLAPGEAVVLSFPALPVEPGAMYELVARTGLPDDADLTSNEVRRVFIRNDGS